MSQIFENLDRAFDFSHLRKEEFPTSNYKSVAIIGGGTAGYFTALALRKAHPYLKIDLIESPRIPVIGVGESTTTEILPFLHQFLEIDPVEFFNAADPTLKLGITFDWGKPKQPPFHFNFFASHHHESYVYDGHINQSNLASVLMEDGKVPVLMDEENNPISLMSRIPFAYHIDNKKFVTFLKQQVLKSGVTIHEATVSEVSVAPGTGEIDGVRTEEGATFNCDLYIDCTGFKASLIGEQLKTPFVSYSETLVTDKAITFNLPNNGTIEPSTGAITMKNGWCWKIPMREEDHYGYVHSSRFCTEDEALTEIQERFGKIDSHRVIHFRSGRHEKAWNKNVFSVGNAYGFVEPLESTAIQSIIYSVMLLCRLMPRSSKDTSSIRGLNKEIAANWDSFRWFLGAHYKFNYKVDSDFWTWCHQNIEIGHAQDICDLFQAKAPLSHGHFGTTSGYAAHAPLVFNAYSYDSLLFGQHLIKTETLAQPVMSREDYEAKIEAYRLISDQALTQAELFSNAKLLYHGVLPDLFEDPESWVQDTRV